MKTLFRTFALLVLLAPALHAATFTVNTTADEFNTPSGTSRSLREAVRDAAASGDVIVFSSALNGGTLTLTTGTEIVINKSLTINAAGLTNGITVSGGTGTNRIFTVNSGKTVALLGLTLRDGDEVSGAGGGAIVNSGTLSLTDCTLTANTSTQVGGAVRNIGGFTATRCTFSGNTAANNGGAVANDAAGVASFSNCTFSGNSQTAANTQGGGAVNTAFSAASATFTHCTFTGNTSAGSEGGGALRVKGAVVTLAYCILSGNTANGGTGPDLFTSAALNFTGANIVAAAIGGGGSTSDPAPITTAPTLGPLASNGGRTQTCALLMGSPSGIDAATGSASTTDQRGLPRVDGDGNSSVVADLGAYETNAPIVVTSTADTGAGSLRQAISAASSAPGPDVITFALSAGSAVGLTTDLTIADAGGVTLQTAVSGGAVDVAVNAGTLSFGGVLSWTGGGRLLLGNTTGSAAATVQMNGPDGFTLAAPIIVRAGSSGVKTLRGVNSLSGGISTNYFSGTVTLLTDATVERTVGTGTFESVEFTGKVDLGGNLLTVNANNPVIFAGQLGRFDGTGMARVGKMGSGLLAFTGDGDNPRLAAQVDAGSLILAKTISSGVRALGSELAAGTTALTVLAGASVDPYSDGQIAPTATVSLAGTMNSQGSETFDVLTGGGSVFPNLANCTLTLGAGNGSGSFSGALRNSTNGSLSLKKTGDGTQTLSGDSGIADGMTGAVTVGGGTLNVTGSLARSSGAMVQSGATLAGTGTVPTVTVASGGTLAPGDATLAGSIGTLNVPGSLTWNGGGTVRSHLGATGASADKLAVTAALTKGSAGSFTFDFQNTGTAGQTYTLATFASSTFTAADFTASNLPAGLVHLFTMTASSLTVSLAAYTDIVTTAGDTGSGSLRDMIILAAAHPGPDTITFAPGFTGPIVLGSEIVITSDVTIDASSVSGGVTIDGGTGSNRIFFVNSGKSLALLGLTLTSGNVSGSGGAIFNQGTLTLTLTQCTLSGNSAINGGAIFNQGTLTLTQCTLSGNSAGINGGAIYNNGTMTMTQCTLSGNTAAYGGAINGSGTLTQCTLTGNTASGNGGAIIPINMTLRHCTVAGNSAGGSTGGGGVYASIVGALVLENSIVAGNSLTGSGSGADIRNEGTVNASGANIVQTAIVNFGTVNGSATIANVNPLLAPLGNYGGPTQTMALLPGSTARNAAVGSSVTSDQRGFPTFGTADVGAFEAQINPIPNQIGTEDQATTIFFSANNVGTLSATSSNTTLLPNANIIISPPNTLLIIPAANQNGTTTITLTDSISGETLSFLLTIIPVNNTPTLTAISNPSAILEDAGQQTINLAGIGTGAANETQTLVVTATSDNTALIPNPTVTYTSPSATGTLKYKPVANANGAATITVTVNDGQDSNNIVTQTFTVNVTAVNDAPNFTKGANQSVVVTAGAQSIPNWATAISAGPANESGQTLSFTVTNNNTPLFTAQPAVAANGTLSYTPASGANGTATVSVSLQDDGGTANGGVNTSAVRTFTINVFSLIVTNSNDSGAGSLRQAVITAAGTAEVDTIVFSGVTGPIVLNSQITIDNDVTIDASGVNGGLTLNGGSGNNRIFNVNSGKSLTLVGLTLTSGNLTGNNGGAISNNGTLTLTQCTLSGNSADSGGAILNSGTLSATGCTFSTNSATTNGGAVTNGSGGSATFTQCTFSANSHAGPTQGGGAINHTNSGTSMTLTHCTLTGNTCTGSDGGGGIRNRGPLLTLSYCLIAGNSVTVGTGADVNSNSAITLTGANLMQTATVGGTTTGPAPIFATPPLGLLASNGGSTQTHALLVGSAGIGAATGSSASEDQRGFDTVGTPDLGAYEVQLGSIATTTTDEDTDSGAIAINVGTIGTLSAVSSVPGLVSSFTFGGSGSSRTLVISPAANQNGSATITVTESLNNDAQTFTLNVTAVNDVPTLAAIPNPTAILEDAAQQTINLAGIGTGAANETQTLVVTATSDNTALIPNPTVTYTSPSATGSLTYTPVADASGSAVITVTVNDGQASNNTVTQTFTITVNAVNDLPSFTKGADLTVAEDAVAQTIPGWATNISDGDADVTQGLSFAVTNNNNALFSVQPAITGGGTLSFTPAADAYGSATVSVSLTDDTTAGGAALTSAVQTFTITIDAVNDAPTLSGLVNQVTLEDTATGALAFTVGDVDTAVGTLVMTGASSNTTLVPDGNIIFGGSGASRTVTITPAANLNGSTTITLSVNDGEHTTTGSFQLTVTPVNDAPSFTVGANLSVTDDAGAQSLPQWATEISDGDPEVTQALTFNLSNDANALFTVQPAVTADGTLTFTPAANAYGTATVSVTLSDAGSNTAPNVNTSPAQTFTITVYTLRVATTEDDGPGSLRDVIANAPAGATITFQNSLAGSSIELSGQIILTRSVILDARSVSGGVTIDGGSGNNRLFTVNSGQTVELKGLFLTDGNIGQGSDGGGAIYNNGSLALTLCTLAGNSATGSGGGAIINFGTLTLAQCTLVNNSTTNGGGAIDNRGALALTQCTLTDNSATNGGALSGGGTLTNCTLVDNTASGIGGAVDVDGPVTLRHCTVVGNSAGGNLSGRGVHVGNGQVLALENSIVAGNTGAGGGADIYNRGTVNASGTNIVRTAIISAGTSSSLTGAATIAYVDPLLAVLGSHGGPTQTMPPMFGSPAIDQASARAPQVLNDQRGAQRPLGPRSDIGAVEADIITVTTAADELDHPLILGAGLSLREAVRDVPAGGTVVFDRAVFTGATASTNTLTLTRGPLNPPRDCTLDGSTNPGGITILTLLPIVQQPQSQSVGSGTPVAFSVNVTNVSGGVSYQWWKDGVVLDGKNLPGYTISSAGEPDEGAYEVTLGEAAAPGALTLINVVKPAATGRSQPATLTVDGSPVTIRRHPAHAMLALGSSHTLSVAATGPSTPPLTYQWLKNEVKIPGATSSSYVIPSAALTHAGSYTCAVKSGTAVGASSNAAEIVVVDTRPMTVNLPTSASFTATVRAEGPNLSFVWKRNDTLLPTNSRSFTMNSNSLIPLAAGLYTCTVTGTGGVITNGFNTRLNLISNAPILETPLALPAATIGQAYYYQIPVQPTFSRAATSFSVSGTLPTGITLNTTTGVVSGRPTVTRPAGYPLTFRATNLRGGSEAVAATLMVNALPANAVGTFAGPAERSTLNDDLGGRLDLTTTTTGLCSGSVTLGARAKIIFTNQLLLSDGANDLVLRATLSGITMADKTPLAASLEIFVLEQVARLTLTHPNGNSLIIPAWRNAWNGTTNKATAYAAYYTARLDAGQGYTISPDGYGYASFTVSTVGALTVAGKLPDGSGLTGGTFVGANGEVLLFNLLYASRGSIVGQFNLTAVTPTADNVLGGSFSWFKPGPKPPLTLLTSTDTVYKAGFGPLNVVAEGGVYVPPAKGQRVMGLLTVPNPNAKLSFTLGGLAPEFTQALNIVNPNATGLTNTAVIAAPTNTTKLPTLDAAKGLFTGSFQINGAMAVLNRPAPFFGQLVRIGTSTQGYGYFLLPTATPKISTSPKLSGRVVLGVP